MAMKNSLSRISFWLKCTYDDLTKIARSELRRRAKLGPTIERLPPRVLEAIRRIVASQIILRGIIPTSRSPEIIEDDFTENLFVEKFDPSGSLVGAKRGEDIVIAGKLRATLNLWIKFGGEDMKRQMDRDKMISGDVPRDLQKHFVRFLTDKEIDLNGLVLTTPGYKELPGGILYGGAMLFLGNYKNLHDIIFQKVEKKRQNGQAEQVLQVIETSLNILRKIYQKTAKQSKSPYRSIIRQLQERYNEARNFKDYKNDATFESYASSLPLGFRSLFSAKLRVRRDGKESTVRPFQQCINEIGESLENEQGIETWVHGDLHPGNILVKNYEKQSDPQIRFIDLNPTISRIDCLYDLGKLSSWFYGRGWIYNEGVSRERLRRNQLGFRNPATVKITIKKSKASTLEVSYEEPQTRKDLFETAQSYLLNYSKQLTRQLHDTQYWRARLWMHVASSFAGLPSDFAFKDMLGMYINSMMFLEKCCSELRVL